MKIELRISKAGISKLTNRNYYDLLAPDDEVIFSCLSTNNTTIYTDLMKNGNKETLDVLYGENGWHIDSNIIESEENENIT